jgi:threonine/homoserine/homoserine lactone efflux protein
LKVAIRIQGCYYVAGVGPHVYNWTVIDASYDNRESMAVSTLIVFALALIVAAGSPGPSIAALVARVLTNGFRDVLPFLAAMWLGEALWLTCAVTGLAVVAHRFSMAFIALKFLGVGYLLFLAWKMWRAPTEVSKKELPSSESPWRMFAAGFMVTLGNPKIMVFYLALVPTILDLRSVGTVAWAELTATMLVVLMSVDLGWALLAARARQLLRSHRAVKIANRTSATMMAGAAAAIAAR